MQVCIWHTVVMKNSSNRTPGYNCRLTIKFSADKNGRPLAHYWSQSILGSGRWIKMSYDAAQLFIAQEQADRA